MQAGEDEKLVLSAAAMRRCHVSGSLLLGFVSGVIGCFARWNPWSRFAVGLGG